ESLRPAAGVLTVKPPALPGQSATRTTDRPILPDGAAEYDDPNRLASARRVRGNRDMTGSPSERICVVVGRTRHKMVQAEIKEAVKRGARLIELRLDFLAKAPDFKRLLADKSCQLMATVRRPAAGGRWGGTEKDGQTLLRQAIVGGFDWVDLETDVADTIRRFGKVKRVVSYHNMHEVPADLEQIHERMCRQDADVVKVAVRGLQPEDNVRL